MAKAAVARRLRGKKPAAGDQPTASPLGFVSVKREPAEEEAPKGAKRPKGPEIAETASAAATAAEAPKDATLPKSPAVAGPASPGEGGAAQHLGTSAKSAPTQGALDAAIAMAPVAVGDAAARDAAAKGADSATDMTPSLVAEAAASASVAGGGAATADAACATDAPEPQVPMRTQLVHIPVLVNSEDLARGQELLIFQRPKAKKAREAASVTYGSLVKKMRGAKLAK